MKKKRTHQDDNRTIANMNVEGMPWYQSEKDVQKRKAINDLQITRKEKWAMLWGAFIAFLPVFLIIIGSFIVVYLLLYLLFFR